MKRIFWVGTSRDDLAECPKSIRNSVGYALYLVQGGDRPPSSKVLSGMGSAKILEIRENDESGTYEPIQLNFLGEFLA